MHILIIAFLVAISSVAGAEEDLRSGAPKDCYLYSWGKGPNWTAKVSAEFRLSLLNLKMPYVDDQYSEPTEKALTWIDRQKEPTITTLATVEGRKVIQIVYPEKGSFGKTIRTILRAIETARDSEWFSPFFGAQPELYRGQFVSGRDVAFGYVATLEWSGTGALRSHYLFDLRRPHPAILATADAGRVRRLDYDSDAEYEEALKMFEREADLLAGIVSRTKPSGKKPHRPSISQSADPANSCAIPLIPSGSLAYHPPGTYPPARQRNADSLQDALRKGRKLMGKP
ncbi:MAG TPA: hypothetical protein VL334_24095, partial [Anaerolineae bacterium]|nr:hypothetical protein [Anaerolineae bacterium]